MGACGEDQELEDAELEDGKTKAVVLAEPRHLEAIVPHCNEPHCWRLKDRMKTVSVALVLCLNIPVDPPDVVKLQPCARLEAWVDPLSMPPTKASEAIGTSLQKAYERGQPKARYKIASDPTMEDIKKLCTSLRRNAKEERVLFHYNGHGVPRPTDNGELWVFNSNYTQYIPLSIYDLQQWMGVPSIYVYDCSHAGKIVKLFKTFSKVHDEGKCIQLASCGEKELLPMNPDLPADLFTACLTTPVKIAIRYYLLQNKKRLLTEINWEMIDKIPGSLSDRRSMLGELNWIFTAITDTIAWNTLPRDLFQKLFRQDLLVASLFRNFLLAQRIMRSYDCTPVSSPPLPCTYQNHMWNAWDLVLKLSLSQLPRLLSMGDPGSRYISSPFFEEQLTAFQVWLSLGSINRPPPEQLPIVLQVLLSQVYRPRALELLGTFLGLGPWAVNLVLEVGIFPYILRLLQSPARELRPLLTLLWSKILAVDPQCKADLVRESGIKYFTNVLRDSSMASDHRTMAAFVMCSLVSDCPEKEFASLKGSILPMCLELLLDEHAPLRHWAAICAARTWDRRPEARWEATRDNAPQKLEALLKDAVPEVRASATYALGTFIRSLPLGDRSEQGRSINHNIAVNLKDKVAEEASPLVKHELVVALHCLVLLYESAFCQVAKQYYAELNHSHMMTKDTRGSLLSPSLSIRKLSTDMGSRISESSQQSASPASSATEASAFLSPVAVRRTGSVMSLVSPAGMFSSSLSYGRLYLSIWEAFIQLKDDPHPTISSAATKVVNYIWNKITTSSSSEDTVDFRSDLSSKLAKVILTINENSPKEQSSTPLSASRRSSLNHQPMTEEEEFLTPLISTHLVEWSSKAFMKTGGCSENEKDSMSLGDFLSSCEQPSSSDRAGKEKHSHGPPKVEEQLFYQRNPGLPSVLALHPTDMSLVVGDANHITVWDVDKNARINRWNNLNCGSNGISSLAILNPNSSYTYLAVGCDNGSVRVWRDPFKSSDNAGSAQSRAGYSDDKVGGTSAFVDVPHLVTAFQALDEVAPARRGGGFLMSWEQKSHMLIVGGESDKIRLWDLVAEHKLLDIHTTGSATTSLHSLEGEGAGRYIVAGFLDGYIRLFDRKNPRPIVRQWKDFHSCVIKTQLFKSSNLFAQFISAADSGEVRLYDLRRSASVQVCSPVDNQKTLAMAYHPTSHLIAMSSISTQRGSRNQQITINHASGPRINTIPFYDGLVGQRNGHVMCMTFHSSRTVLASGTTEGVIAVHGASKR